VSLATATSCYYLLYGVGQPFWRLCRAEATGVVPQARAAMVSLFAAALFLGSGEATAALAPLADDHRWTAMFVGAAVLTAAFGVVAALVRTRWQPSHRADISPV
jgi:hypothetical protein